MVGRAAGGSNSLRGSQSVVGKQERDRKRIRRCADSVPSMVVVSAKTMHNGWQKMSKGIGERETGRYVCFVDDDCVDVVAWLT